MLLYRRHSGEYVAVHPAFAFSPVNGFESCFRGRDVPDIICRAFIRESGGYEVAQAEEVELQRYPLQGSRLGPEIVSQ